MAIKANEPKLGELAPECAGRDAIHVAVIPVVAARLILPGDPIKILPDGRADSSGGDDSIGVADPFLEEPVVVGERFWLLLYPGTITSLRHIWSHPAFPPTSPPAAKEQDRE